MTKLSIALMAVVVVLSGAAAFSTVFHNQPTNARAEASIAPWHIALPVKNLDHVIAEN